MATTFQVLYLGNLAEIDTAEGNTIAENAGDLVGLEFGDAATPLAQSIATWAPAGDADSNYDTDNLADTDQFTINGGPAQDFDSVVTYNATLTYVDGTTASITAVIVQDTSGETYLVPEFYRNTDQTALEAHRIQSLTLDSVGETDLVGLIADRDQANFVTCFVEGTRIRAEAGDVPIQHLSLGDHVVTLDHGLQPVRWIGTTTAAATGLLAPIRFAPGAIGNHRCLQVSAQHRMLISGPQVELYFGQTEVLAPAHSLINGKDITRALGGVVTYYHIMFDQHELIWSEGCLSESFYPGTLALAALPASARREVRSLFPDLCRSQGHLRYGMLARQQIDAPAARLVFKTPTT